MNNLLLLTKINLKNFFSSLVRRDGKKKSFGKSVLVIGIVLYLAAYIFLIANESLPSFIALDGQNLFLVLIFLAISLYLALINIFKIKSTIFDFKDYDLLMSLPVKKNIVLASKLLTLCLFNYIYELIFMIPCYLAYIKNVSVTPNFHIIYILFLLVIPIAPIAISSVLGIILSAIASLFGNKKLGQYFSYILILFITFYVSFGANDLSANVIVEKLNDLIPKLNNKYPLVNIYYGSIRDLSYTKLLLFTIISIIIFSLVVFIIGILYDRIRTNLLKTKTTNDYKIEEYESHSQLGCLYKKEIKRLFSSASYVFNTLLGCFMLLVALLVILIFKDEFLESILQVPNAISFLKIYGPIIISLCVGLGSTTAASISLEGKNLWILKTSPIKPFTIYLSKILTNLTFTIPTSIISALILSIYFKLTGLGCLYMFLTPIAVSIFSAVIGLILNLLFPNFEWENEAKVIKQSIPAFVSTMIGLIIPIVLIVSFKVKITSFLPLITGIIYVVDILLIYILYARGNKLFRKL